MKRQKRKIKRASQKPRQEPQAAQVPDHGESRRRFLAKSRNFAVAAMVVGGGSWFAVREVRATMREHDLTRIGNGTPTVVQIHDPQCPQCTALQRETRDALCEFDEAELQYVVANIRGTEGAQLARRHGVQHVTLLLFDADGKRRSVMTGVQDSEYLRDIFRGHIARYGRDRGAQPAS